MKIDLDGLNYNLSKSGMTMRELRNSFGSGLDLIVKRGTFTMNSAKKIAKIVGCNVRSIVDTAYIARSKKHEHFIARRTEETLCR